MEKKNIHFDSKVRIISGFFKGMEGEITGLGFAGWEFFGRQFGWHTYEVTGRDWKVKCKSHELELTNPPLN